MELRNRNIEAEMSNPSFQKLLHVSIKDESWCVDVYLMDTKRIAPVSGSADLASAAVCQQPKAKNCTDYRDNFSTGNSISAQNLRKLQTTSTFVCTHSRPVL